MRWILESKLAYLYHRKILFAITPLPPISRFAISPQEHEASLLLCAVSATGKHRRAFRRMPSPENRESIGPTWHEDVPHSLHWREVVPDIVAPFSEKGILLGGGSVGHAGADGATVVLEGA